MAIADEETPLLANKIKPQNPGQRSLKAAGYLSLRLLFFIGCMGTTIILVLELITTLIHIFQFVQDIYTILFCLSLAVVEMCWCPWVPKLLLFNLRRKLFRTFNFLTRAWGKGISSIYIGCIMLTKLRPLFLLSGAYMLGVGLLFLIFGRIVEKKMQRLTDKQILLTLVHQNRDGKIDINELEAAAKAAGMPLTNCEVQLAFALLDTNGDGFISIKELEYYLKNLRVMI